MIVGWDVLSFSSLQEELSLKTSQWNSRMRVLTRVLQIFVWEGSVLEKWKWPQWRRWAEVLVLIFLARTRSCTRQNAIVSEQGGISQDIWRRNADMCLEEKDCQMDLRAMHWQELLSREKLRSWIWWRDVRPDRCLCSVSAWLPLPPSWTPAAGSLWKQSFYIIYIHRLFQAKHQKFELFFSEDCD